MTDLSPEQIASAFEPTVTAASHCVASRRPFSASADFAINKPAGQACPKLAPEFRCGIHSSLRRQGFAGCTVYDCFAAGQQVCQVTFGGLDWRAAPESAQQMFEVFAIMRDLHELAWYLTEALTLQAARPLRGELSPALVKIGQLIGQRSEALLGLDMSEVRQRCQCPAPGRERACPGQSQAQEGPPGS